MSEQLLKEILGELKSTNSKIDNLEKGQESIRNDLSNLTQDVSGLKTDVSVLKVDVSDLKADVNVLKVDVNNLIVTTERIEKRQDMIFNEVGGLMEFRTEMHMKLNALNDNIEFLKFKGTETEEQLFTIKRKLPQVK